MAISSVGRAFAYLLGVRPRQLLRKNRNLKSKNNLELKFTGFNLTQAMELYPVRKVFRNHHFNPNFIIQNPPEDLRAVFEPIQEGPQSIRYGRIKCKVLHRVCIRNVLDAISTTESEEILGEFAGIDTTHSSIIESDDWLYGSNK